jgi:hypothetical protein
MNFTVSKQLYSKIGDYDAEEAIYFSIKSIGSNYCTENVPLYMRHMRLEVERIENEICVIEAAIGTSLNSASLSRKVRDKRAS